MKTISKIIFSITVLLSLTGCLYGQCMNGPCAFERAEIIANIKPYGAHWIKEGMTRESRRFDLIACGSSEGESVWFPSEQTNAERLVGEPNDVAAYIRLRDKVGLCMQDNGYEPVGDLLYLGGCDARCLYP